MSTDALGNPLLDAHNKLKLYTAKQPRVAALRAFYGYHRTREGRAARDAYIDLSADVEDALPTVVFPENTTAVERETYLRAHESQDQRLFSYKRFVHMREQSMGQRRAPPLRHYEIAYRPIKKPNVLEVRKCIVRELAAKYIKHKTFAAILRKVEEDA